MIRIDGSMGEGGGQVLRSSLGLSLVTGAPVCFENIRAGRKRPGLRKQHLAAVRAAAEIGQAEVSGDAVDSRSLSFRPGRVRAGDYEFAVDTAGSMTLVLQTVLPALLRAEQPSRVTLRGGTHNPMAPPWDFLERVYFPLLARLGPRVEGRLERCGFYPKGGGIFRVQVQPAKLEPVALHERGRIVSRRGRALVARLPAHVPERELAVVARELGWSEDLLETVEVRSRGPGNALQLELEYEVEGGTQRELITAFGERGRPAEQVALDAVGQLKAFLDAGAPVGEHLSDQLLLLLALASGGSFRTAGPLSGHAATQVELLPRFLPVAIVAADVAEGVVEVRVSRAASGGA